MTDKQQIFLQVVSAVEAVNNPASPREQRQSAQQYIEKIKQELGPELAEIGFEYARAHTQSQYVQHLGYHFLEHTIANHWNTLTPQGRQSLKQMVLTLLDTTPDGFSPLYQEKTATLISEVAKREWPQQWPDFMDCLVKAMEASDTKAEVVLRTLRTFADDTVSSPFATRPPSNTNGSRWDMNVLTAARRKDILLALRQEGPKLLQLLSSFLQAKHAVYMSASTSEAKSTNATLMGLVQSVIAVMLEVIQPEVVFTYKFPMMWIALMAEDHPGTRMATALCCLEFVGETLNINENNHTEFTQFVDQLSAFCTQFTNSIIANASSIKPEDPAVERTHNFHKTLARIMTALGVNNLSSIKKYGCLGKFVPAVMTLLQHPALSIGEITLELLGKLFEQSFGQSPELQGSFQTLLPLLKAKVMKAVGDPEFEPMLPVTVFSTYDFDGPGDYGHCLMMVRSKAHHILVTMTGFQPGTCLQYGAWAADEMLKNRPEPTPADPRNGFGNVSLRSPTFLEWESTSYVVTTILDQVGLCSKEALPTVINESARQALDPILNKLLDYSPQDGSMIPVLFSILTSFVPYLKLTSGSNNYLQRLMTKVFQYMQYKKAGEQGHQLCEDTKAARKKAHSTFIKLSTKMPDLLLPYLQLIMDQTKELMNNGALLDMEISFLFEAMTAISNKLDMAQQKDFFQVLLGPAITPWTQDVFKVVSDGHLYLQAIGVGAGDRSMSRQIQHCLNVFVGMYRRASPPERPDHSLVVSAQGILPPLLQLVSTLHACWDPSGLKSQIPNELQPILGMGTDDEILITGKVYCTAQQYQEPEQIRIPRNALKDARWASYQLLGLLPLFTTILYDQVKETVQKFVFNPSIQHLEDIHLLQLLKQFVQPYCYYCTNRHHPALGQLLPPLYQFLYNRLNTKWDILQKKLEAQGKSAFEMDEEDEEEDNLAVRREILERRVLRSLTTQSFEVLERIGVAMASQKSKGTKEEAYRHLATYFTQNQNIMNSVLMLVSGAIRWPDAQGAVKAIKAIAKFLPLLASNPEYDQHLYLLMGNCLQRLMATSPAFSTTSTTSAAQEAVSTMYRTSREESLITDIINFVGDVYCAKLAKAQVFARVWLELGMSEAQIQELHNNLQKPSEKQRRLVFKSLLAPVVGRNLPGAAPEKLILRLPQWKIQPNPNPTAEDGNIAIALLAAVWDS